MAKLEFWKTRFTSSLLSIINLPLLIKYTVKYFVLLPFLGHFPTFGHLCEYADNQSIVTEKQRFNLALPDILKWPKKYSYFAFSWQVLI